MTLIASKLFNSIMRKAILLSIILLASSCDQTNTSNYAVLEAPILFTPNIPVDVDPELQESLKKAGDIYQLNQVYNMYSWHIYGYQLAS